MKAMRNMSFINQTAPSCLSARKTGSVSWTWSAAAAVLISTAVPIWALRRVAAIYHSSLDCQWLDITDVDTGQYVLSVKVNWDHSPDALGHYEIGYENNTAQVCIRLTRDAQGALGFEILQECDPLTDCLGVPYGSAEMDCEGICEGQAVKGDLNADTLITTIDAVSYIDGILNESITASPCRDISGDGLISVWDAGLANNCALNGPNNNNCEFPNSVINPGQTATLGYTAINSGEGYIDVFIKNPNSRIVGYEFNVSGIGIGDVESRINPVTYPMTPRFDVGGTKVISLSLVDSTIPKNFSPVPLVRIYYSAITDPDSICVSSVVHVLNTLYEPVLTILEDACLSTAGVAESPEAAFNLFPNPAINQLTVDLQQALTAKTDVKILDASGRTILTLTAEQGQKTIGIPLKGIASGWYKVKIGNATRSFIRE